jgi:hypothetical protein
MGPFVPDLISDQLNLVFGFLIGIAFGFVLEQAGFSSSRKLTGLFYGRDFTVLRVFFTAAITAMSGILLLAHFGLLDLDVIYINPTYLWAAIVGGIIMGFGFILGGYCPGTSVCAAAIGKIDAMVFIGGGVLGVFLFGEIFPYVQDLYLGSFYGEPTVPAALGWPPGIFALAMIAFAIMAFMVTTKIERLLNPASPSRSFPAGAHIAAATAALVIGALLVMLPDRKTALLDAMEDTNRVAAVAAPVMTPDELAFRLLDRDPHLVIIDVRDSAAQAAFPLPGASVVRPHEMFGKQWHSTLAREGRKVLVAESEAGERKAFFLASALGFKGFSVLGGGLSGFRAQILNPVMPDRPLSQAEQDAYRFRRKAGPEIVRMVQETAAGPRRAAPTVKKVAGGCGA